MKVNIRLMKADDFDAVVAIDFRVLKTSRQEYYEMKFERLSNPRSGWKGFGICDGKALLY